MIDLARKNKHLLSNPFNYHKLGYNCATRAYRSHLLRIKKKTPELFAEQYSCSDKDGWLTLLILNEFIGHP